MPRIAFSFPISDEAQFFAHYDVLTQRPPQSNRLEPVDYLFMADRVGALLNNPDLKSEKTVDYELGFAKTLSLRSALKISAFYKELRDMIQVINVLGAYPAQYLTYGNIDFGTVKGMSVNFDLRRTGNVSMTANYTLQFADGTGSSASSGQSLVNTGQPNLRSTIPLAFDQRHAISASVDYRYGSGKDYNGPVLFGKNILSNAGANMVLSAGSGTPYSKQSNITQEAASGINDRSTLEGSLNGSRLPIISSAAIPLIQLGDMKELDIHVPDIETQIKIISAHEAINKAKKLHNEYYEKQESLLRGVILQKTY